MLCFLVGIKLIVPQVCVCDACQNYVNKVCVTFAFRLANMHANKDLKYLMLEAWNISACNNTYIDCVAKKTHESNSKTVGQ